MLSMHHSTNGQYGLCLKEVIQTGISAVNFSRACLATLGRVRYWKRDEAGVGLDSHELLPNFWLKYLRS